MKFKVGQRVRIIWQSPSSIASYGSVMGREAVFTGYSPSRKLGKHNCTMLPDGESVEWDHHTDYLAPLTDPGFESFMERIQKPLTKPEWEAA